LEIATTGDKIRPRGANGKIFGLSGSGGALTARAPFIVTAQSVFGVHLDEVVHTCCRQDRPALPFNL
jgi:hypothetical protein